jgi:hypothetical protein
MTKRRQEGHKELLGLRSFQANGNKMKKAINHLKKFSVRGGTKSLTKRPTTALPAHSNGGTVSIKAVPGESFCVMPATLTPSD